MNNAKLSLMKRFPQFFYNDIMRLVNEYNEEASKRRREIQNHDYSQTELEKIIIGGNASNIIKYIDEQQISLDVIGISRTNPELLANKDFLKLMIKRYPYVLLDIDEKYLDDNNLELLVNTIISNNLRINYPISQFFWKNDEFVNYAIESCKDSNIFMDLLNNLVRFVPDKVDMAVSHGKNNKLFDRSYIYELDDRALSNEKIINEFDFLNINTILRINDMNPELAKKTFIRLVKDNAIERNSFVDLRNFNVDKDIVNAIFESDKVIYFIEIIKKANIELFTDEQIDYLIDNNITDLVNFNKSKKSLRKYIELGRDISSFSDELIQEYVEESNLTDSQLDYIVSYINSEITSPKLIKKYAEKLKDRLNKDDRVDSFRAEAFSDENLEIYVQKINNERDIYNLLPLHSSVLVNERIFKYLLDNLNDVSILFRFDASLFNSDNIKVFCEKYKGLNPNVYISDSIMNNQQVFIKLIENKFSDMKVLNKFSASVYNEEILAFLYKKFDLMDVLGLNYVKEHLYNFSKSIKMDDVDIINNMNKLVINVDYIDDVIKGLLIIKNYNKSSVKNSEMDEIKNRFLMHASEFLKRYGYEDNDIKLFIDRAINGVRDPLSLLMVHSGKSFRFNTYINDFYHQQEFEYIENLPNEIINKINPKHIDEIVKLLREHKFNERYVISLAINIYMTIGYERAVSLLSPNPKKNYGEVNQVNLINMFGSVNLVDILFKKEGNGYVPVLNEKLLNMVFGNSNKVKNTPIRNYLNYFADKKEEIDKKIEVVNNDLTLTPEEKKALIDKYNEEFEKYKKNINTFFEMFSRCYSEWDMIEEEFMKMASKSKLNVKLNIQKINEILKNKTNIRKAMIDEVEDAELLETDVFDYVGYDTQFTAEPSLAPRRAVMLSREMNKVFTKKFPNVNITKGEYTINVYNPQDRAILSAGYRSGCCFRPNGNADNSGQKESLLRYCATTEYGGGVEIKDKNGKTILFSPLLRNGNVLMIHSIETTNSNIPKECYLLLKEFAEKVIEESKKEKDNIDFVTITDLHYLDDSITCGMLPEDIKFMIYDPDKEYEGMYSNLSCNHMIIAFNQEKKVEDIKYGEVEHSYEYPIKKTTHKAEIKDEGLDLYKKIDELNQEIIKLSNLRHEALKVSDEEKSYKLLEEIKDKKQQYLKLYKQNLELSKGKNPYQEIKSVIKVISTVSKDFSLDKLDNYSEIIYGKDWYIVITKDKKIVSDCLESGREEMKKHLEELKNISRSLVVETIQVNTDNNKKQK